MGGPMFAGKKVLVTGAASGIGLAAARRFADEGADLALFDVNPAVRDVAEGIAGQSARRVTAFVGDLRSRDDVESAVAQAVADHGVLDVLANVAAIFPIRRFEDFDDAAIADIFDVNVHGPMRMCRAAIPHLPREGRGVIVNIASGSAFLPIEGLTAYGASKAAVVAFSRSLALELAPHIRVNVVSPGTTASPPVKQTMEARGPEAFAEFLKHIPMGRLAEPEDIAEAILFVASDRASHITGTTLPVNGGSLMR